jgi:hypothetical protein
MKKKKLSQIKNPSNKESNFSPQMVIFWAKADGMNVWMGYAECNGGRRHSIVGRMNLSKSPTLGGKQVYLRTEGWNAEKWGGVGNKLERQAGDRSDIPHLC